MKRVGTTLMFVQHFPEMQAARTDLRARRDADPYTRGDYFMLPGVFFRTAVPLIPRSDPPPTYPCVRRVKSPCRTNRGGA